MIATQTIAIMIRNCVENALFAICITIKAKYDSIGHGNIGKKFPINHNIIASIESIIRRISMWVESFEVLK